DRECITRYRAFTYRDALSLSHGIARPCRVWQSKCSCPHAAKPNSRSRVMAARKKSGGRKYGKASSKRVESAMRRRKKGTLRSGPGGKGGKVKSRKQAIVSELSEARKKGAKVPRKSSGRKSSGSSSSGRKSSRKKSSARKR